MTDSSGEARTPQEGTVDAGALAEASKLYAELDDLSLRITDERLDEIHDRLLSLGRSLLAYIKQLEERVEAKDRENVKAMRNSVYNLGAMRRWRKCAEKAEAQVKQLEGERDALREALTDRRPDGTRDERKIAAALRPSEADVMATTEIPEVDVQRAAKLARERGWKNIPVVGDES